MLKNNLKSLLLKIICKDIKVLNLDKCFWTIEKNGKDSGANGLFGSNNGWSCDFCE